MTNISWLTSNLDLSEKNRTWIQIKAKIKLLNMKFILKRWKKDWVFQESSRLIPFLLKSEGWLDTPMISMSKQHKAISKTPYMNLHNSAES